jgi:hypothetical protein
MSSLCAGEALRAPVETEGVAVLSSSADLPEMAPRSSADATIGVSASSLAVMAAAALVYVSGSFLIAEALGFKRPAQALLAVPIVLMASYYVATQPRRLLDPLIGFILLKTVAEVAFRGTALDLFDDMASLFAVMAIRGAPARALEQGVRLVTVLAGVFAVMALVQWIALFFEPDLLDELLTVDDEGKVVGNVHHVVALLGLATGELYTLFGHTVSRLQSFAREPSLNLVYFLLPSAMAFLRGGGMGVFWGALMVGFCVLSLSGSVLLSLAFSAAAWFGLRIFSLRRMLAWGPVLILGLYLTAMQTGGLGSVISFITFVSGYGDFMSKEQSFTYRAGGAASSLAAAASAPLGSTKLPELPAPWMVNGALMAGWLGAAMLLLFVRSLAFQLQALDRNRRQQWSVRVGALILIGALTTVIVFNDYQMSNYPGLVLLALVYRWIEAQNEIDSDRRSATPKSPAGPRQRLDTAEHAAKAV